MSWLFALALAQAVLAGAAAVLAVVLGDQRRMLAGQRALAVWASLASLALVGGAVSLVGTGGWHWFGLFLREFGTAGTIVLIVIGTGRLVGRQPPSWLVLLLIASGLFRLALMPTTDLLYLSAVGTGIAETGALYAPTAAVTFPLVLWWLAVTRSAWADRVERDILTAGLVGMMVLGVVAAFGAGLPREVGVGVLTAPLLLAFVAVHRHRRRQLHVQVQAIRHHEEELARALETTNVQLRRALTVRDDLLDVVTHELRTPLTPIRGFLELLSTGEQRLDAPGTPELIDLMLRNAVRLNGLIDEALLARQLRRGSLELPAGPEVIEVAPLVERVLDRVSVDPGLVDAAVAVAVADGLQVLAVPADAEHVLHQVIENAFRHGQPPIIIRGREVGGSIEVEVRDHGLGVPTEFRDHLFELFTQASTGERREVGGLGLGLGVARRLAESNGGHVREEAPEGVGACFVVVLPMPGVVADPEAPVARVGPAVSVTGSKTVRP